MASTPSFFVSPVEFSFAINLNSPKTQQTENGKNDFGALMCVNEIQKVISLGIEKQFSALFSNEKKIQRKKFFLGGCVAKIMSKKQME